MCRVGICYLPDHVVVKDHYIFPLVLTPLGVTVVHVRCWRQGTRLGVTFWGEGVTFANVSRKMDVAEWSLQLDLKRRERNVVKPVIVCKSEEQRDVCTGTDSCILMNLFWPGKRLKWLFEAGWEAKVSLVDVTVALRLR